VMLNSIGTRARSQRIYKRGSFSGPFSCEKKANKFGSRIAVDSRVSRVSIFFSQSPAKGCRKTVDSPCGWGSPPHKKKGTRQVTKCALSSRGRTKKRPLVRHLFTTNAHRIPSGATLPRSSHPRGVQVPLLETH